MLLRGSPYGSDGLDIVLREIQEPAVKRRPHVPNSASERYAALPPLLEVLEYNMPDFLGSNHSATHSVIAAVLAPGGKSATWIRIHRRESQAKAGGE